MKQFETVRLILTTSLTDREIGAAAGVSKTTVGRYRRLVQTKRLRWEDVAELTPAAIQQLFNQPASGGKSKRTPDLALVHDQLQAKGMTLQPLWEEFRREDPHGTLSYSHLAAKVKGYRETLPTVMRQHHTPGERMFVDYSGLRPHYIDTATREKVYVELFVGVLPASSLMFAMCTPTQRVPDFIRAHVAMLDYIGGVPMVIVPDNLKSAVTTAGRAPTIQRSYADFARHYGVAVLPARPYRPRDKAAVEAGVKFAQQRILSHLRHHQFYSIDELNTEIAKLLEDANARPMVKDGLSRRSRFEALERAALKPLPPLPYVYAEWVAVPVLYSTHSPYLIDHKRIDRILAVERDAKNEDSNTIVRRGLDLAASSHLTLAPVLAVMGTDLSSQQLIQRTGNILLEENSAYFYFAAFVLLTKKGQGLALVACNGANNVPVVADLLTAWRLDFKAAFDDDEKGKTVARKLRDKWLLSGEEYAARILLFQGCAGIEDGFTADEFETLVAVGHQLAPGATNAKRVEAAKLSKPTLAHHFYMAVKDGRVAAGQLSAETLERFAGWLGWMER